MEEKIAKAIKKAYDWAFAIVKHPKTRRFFRARHRSPYDEEPLPFPQGILPEGEPDPKILRSPQPTEKRKTNPMRGTVAWEQYLEVPRYACLTPLAPAAKKLEDMNWEEYPGGVKPLIPFGFEVY
jgi:hypothetical protein